MVHYRTLLPILTITILCHSRYSRNKLLSSVQHEDISLCHITAGIKDIIKKYFIWETHLLIIGNDPSSYCKLDGDILKDIHSSTTVSTISLLNFTNVKDFGRFHVQDNIENSVSFIVFQSEILNSCFSYDYWVDSNFWNPRAFFLLVITRNVSEKTVTMKNMFEDCWARYSILNMLVVFWSSPSLEENSLNINESWLSKSKVRIMNYNPFTKEVYLTNPSDTYKTISAFQGFYDKLQDTKGFVLDSPIDLFHPLVIDTVAPDGIISLGGPNGNMFATIIEKMNFTANIFYLNEQNLNYYDNVNSTTHGLSTHQHFLVRHFNHHKSTYPHDLDCITLIVPRALEIPKYMNIILPFSATIWLMFVLINLFMAFVWKVLALYNIPGSKIPPQSSVLLETFNMSLGGAPRSLPSLYSQRFLVLMCLVFNLLMNSTYKGLLYSFLTIPMYYPDMNTIMEALDSDLKISIFSYSLGGQHQIDYSELNDNIFTKMQNKFTYIDDDKEALHMIISSRNVGIICPKLDGRITASNPQYIRDGRAQLHVVEDCFITSLCVFSSVEDHSPFLNKFTDIIVRLIEAGFNEKWKKDILFEISLKFIKINHRSNLNILKVENLQSVYYFHGFGLIVASLVIFAEMAVHFVHKMY